MKIKVFTADQHGNLSISKKELEELLNEAYWEGYRAPHYTSYTINTPHYTWDCGTITLCSTNEATATTTTCSNSSLNATNGTLNITDDKLEIKY